MNHSETCTACVQISTILDLSSNWPGHSNSMVLTVQRFAFFSLDDPRTWPNVSILLYSGKQPQVVLEVMPGTSLTTEMLHDIFKSFVHSEKDNPLLSLTEELTLGTSAYNFIAFTCKVCEDKVSKCFITKFFCEVTSGASLYFWYIGVPFLESGNSFNFKIVTDLFT